MFFSILFLILIFFFEILFWKKGGSYDSSEHNIHVWDFNYGNVEILEGPKETIVDLCWHPVFPVIVSASTEGEKIKIKIKIIIKEKEKENKLKKNKIKM